MANISGVSNDTPAQEVSARQPQSSKPVGSATTSAVEGAAEAADTEIAISTRATDAQALLAGAASAESPEDDPTVNDLSSLVGKGEYRRPSSGIAKALLTFERQVGRRSTGE